MDAVVELADDIANADTVVAFTGAGVSTASGIPDFRSDSGVWERLDPADFHVRRFRQDPEGFWEDRLELHETMYADGPIEPNEAHDALATLAADGVLDALVTQNTDGLHGDADDAELIELHGNAHRVVCETCGKRFDAAPVRRRVADGEAPPTCEICGEGVLKPDVVLFGEQLPPNALSRANDLARTADVFLALGSSLTVEPAASLPRIASDTGATLAIVNLERTSLTDSATYNFEADVTGILPQLRDEIDELF